MVSTKKVGEDQAFVTVSGARLYSIKDLASYVKSMDSNEFSYHVNDQRNDFANWINDVFSEKALAKKVSGSQSDVAAVLQASFVKKTVAKKAPAKKTSSVVSKAKPTKAAKPTPKKPVVKVVTVKKSAPKKQAKKPVVKVKKLGFFEKNPHVKTEEEETAEKKLNIHEQITHLENQTKHMTRYHKNTNRAPLSDKDVDIKEHLVDFTLGLIIGIVLGFILAKSLGLVA